MGLRFDVLIVGGGPAGSVAALVLARGGLQVALVDKSAFPRDKACGDVVGPRGLQVLVDLQLTIALIKYERVVAAVANLLAVLLGNVLPPGCSHIFANVASIHTKRFETIPCDARSFLA